VGPTALGVLPGADYSSADGVNADGSVIVGVSGISGVSVNQPFRWTSTDGMLGLGNLPDTVTVRQPQSALTAKSSLAQVLAIRVGTHSPSSGRRRLAWSA
jgi:probable HAF family extracellular repeat protein